MKFSYFIFFPLSLFLCRFQVNADFNGTKEILPNQFRLNGISTQNAFGITKKNALLSTVRLTRNDKLIAMGAIVSSLGHVLTKASSCVGARKATLSNGESYSLRIKKRNEDLDLALYQMISERNDFQPISWKDGNVSKDVSWVLSAYTELEEIRVGVTSGKLREIGREGGVMGVILGNESKMGVLITEVIPHAAADKSGIQMGDIIQKIDGRSVRKRDQVVNIVGKKDPGDVVVLNVVRIKEEKAFQVTLGHRSVTFDLFNRNMQMSGPVSKRKDNFPLILQHDLPLPKEAMGGPIFDLSGECIGINIARVDRVTTFTLPTKIVFPVVQDFLK